MRAAVRAARPAVRVRVGVRGGDAGRPRRTCRAADGSDRGCFVSAFGFGSRRVVVQVVPAGDLAELEALRAENARLRAEVHQLRDEQAHWWSTTRPSPPPVAAQPAFGLVVWPPAGSAFWADADGQGHGRG